MPKKSIHNIYADTWMSTNHTVNNIVINDLMILTYEPIFERVANSRGNVINILCIQTKGLQQKNFPEKKF